MFLLNTFDYKQYLGFYQNTILIQTCFHSI